MVVLTQRQHYALLAVAFAKLRKYRTQIRVHSQVTPDIFQRRTPKFIYYYARALMGGALRSSTHTVRAATIRVFRRLQPASCAA